MIIDDVFSSKYLKASDLRGRDVLVTIAGVEEANLKGGDKKLLMTFAGKEKGLIVNKTNANRIAQMFGRDTDRWVGKQITLFPTQVEFQGDYVDAIRVKGHLEGRQEQAFTAQAPKRSVATQDDPRTVPQIDDDEQRARFELNDEVPF
jgi:hypothetical protein